MKRKSSPALTALEVLDEYKSEIDLSWLYDVNDDYLRDNLSFERCYDLCHGFIRGLMSVNKLDVIALDDYERNIDNVSRNKVSQEEKEK